MNCPNCSNNNFDDRCFNCGFGIHNEQGKCTTNDTACEWWSEKECKWSDAPKTRCVKIQKGKGWI